MNSVSGSVPVVPVPDVSDAAVWRRFGYMVGDRLATGSAEQMRAQVAALRSPAAVPPEGLALVEALLSGLADGRDRDRLLTDAGVPRVPSRRAVLEFLVRTGRTVRPRDLE